MRTYNGGIIKKHVEGKIYKCTQCSRSYLDSLACGSHSDGAKSCRLFVTLICLLWFGVLALRAANNYYVATNGTDSGTCESWATAASNIQYAVNLAIGDRDTVWVSNGTYRVTNSIMITNNITVRGLNGWTNTIVYADSAYTNQRCFYVSCSGVLDGFTITNGHYMANNDYNGGGGAFLATGTIQNCYFANNISSNNGYQSGGGGVYIKDAGTVSNCIFISNTSFCTSGGSTDHLGGGAINIYKNANVLKCVMSQNQAAGVSGRGGGIFQARTASPLISNCTFNANTAVGNSAAIIIEGGGYMTDCVITNHASSGGTITFFYSSSSMRNCLIANNSLGRILYVAYGASATNCTIANNDFSQSSAVNYGCVGLKTDPDTPVPVLERCVFSNNICRSGNGGGAVAITNSGVLRNCLIHHNTNMSASGNGGGVFLANAANIGSVTNGLYNCTITDNYSTNGGGGIAAFGMSNYIVNCIIAGNNAYSNTYAEIYNTGENSNNYWYSCANVTSAPLAAGQGNITNGPVFAGAGNWRLNANSPCINKGTNQNWMTNSYDLDSRTRIRYGTVDVGAYERINEGTICKLW